MSHFTRTFYRPWQEAKSLLKTIRRKHRSCGSYRPSFEVLEDRTLLSLAAPINQILPTGQQPVDVKLPLLDGDNLTDVAVLGSDGSLTTAFNDGANEWRNVQTTSLGIGSADGMVFGHFEASNLALDLAVQGPNAITIFHGDGAGHFTLLSTLSAPRAGSFAPSGGGHVDLNAVLLNTDVFPDLIALSPGTNEVLVYRGKGDGTFASPVHYASGGASPDALAIGDFIGDTNLDLAIGNSDGTVTFLQGLTGDSFQARPDLTVGGLGAVTGLAAGSFDGSGTSEIAVSSRTGITILNNHHQPPANSIPNGSFAEGLTGWTATGPVTAENGLAQLQEGTNFLTTLQKTFFVPARPQALSFDLLSVNLENPSGGVPDAFEASLLNPNQASVVPTWNAQATSFFNVNPGNVVSTAAGVTFDGRHVTVDISHLTPGTPVTLYFDLIGNPPGSGSTATIGNVQVTQQPVAESFGGTLLTGPFGAPAGIAAADVDGDGHLDLVVADGGLNKIIVYNGDGTGNFTRSDVDVTPYGSLPSALATAPLTVGNSIADLAVALKGSNRLLSPLVYDTTPPQVTIITPSTGQVLNTPVTQIVVQFSEAVQDNGPTGNHSVTNPAAYVLVNTTTNQTIAIALVSYNPATFQAVLTIAAGAGPLADGAYKLTIKAADPTLAILDLAGNSLASGVDAVSTFTADATAPVATLALGPNVLWSANHQMVNIHATITASDSFDSHPTFTLVSITSNEPDSGTGPGDLPNDIQNAAYGTATQDFSLRAEESPTGNGRVYTVTYYVRDAAGNGRIVSAFVAVPKAPVAGQSSIAANFNGTAIASGQTIWFTSALKANNLGSGPTTIRLVGQTISFTANNVNYVLAVHDASITYSPTATSSTTTFDTVNNQWVTTVPMTGLSGNQFLSALAYPVPVNLPGGIQNVTWTGQFLSATSGVSVNWAWAAAVYTSFPTNYNSVGVKPVDDNSTSQYKNSDPAGTPENEKSYVTGGATGGGGGNYTGSLSGTVGLAPSTGSSVIAALGNATPPGLSRLQSSTVTKISNYSLQVGSAVSGSIAQAGQVNVYSFTATAGQRVFFDVQAGGSSGFHWALTDPNGNIVFNDTFQTRDTTALASGGTYYLTIDGRSGQTGSYQFELFTVPNPTTTSYNPGSVAAGTIAVPGQQDQYSFSGLAGQRIFIDVQNSAGGVLSFTILAPGGATLLVAGNQNQNNRIILPANGLYTVVVARGSTLDATGSYQFQIDSLSTDVPRSISMNTPTNGVLITPGQTASYSFHGNLGQQVLVNILSDYAGLITFTLLDPGGNTIFANQTSDQLVRSLPATGTYTLVVQPLGDRVSSFSFQVIDQSAVPTPIVTDPSFNIGDVVMGTLLTPTQVDRWTFTATAGQNLFFNAQTPNFFFFWGLIDPNGNTVFAGRFNDHDTLTVNLTGTYIVQVVSDSFFGDTGSYQFQVFNVPPIVAVPFNINQPVSGNLAIPGEVDLYTFQGTAGQRLFFDVQVNTGGLFSFRNFTIHAPDGSVFASNRFSMGPFTLTQTGTYQVFVDDAGDLASTGPYQFEIFDVSTIVTTGITIDQIVSSALTIPGQQANYTFTGTAGQNVYFSLQNDPSGNVGFTLLAPDGSTVFGQTNGNFGPFVLPQSGTYTIVVSHFLNFFYPLDVTGPFQFQLFEVIGAGAADSQIDSKGTDFWVGFPANILVNGFQILPPPSETLYITSDQNAKGNISVPGLNYLAFFTVQPGQTTNVYLPSTVELGGGDTVQNLGIHVTADHEISVAGASLLFQTSDSFRALPADALGNDYLVMSYGGARAFTASEAAVVATANNTVLTITPTANVGAHPAGMPYTVTLNQGQAYELQASGSGDLTGTDIAANQPISVFGGHISANIPVNVDFENYLIEQMVPVAEWGTHYISVPLATRTGGDTFRILASANNTHVTINGVATATLNRGQFYETILTGLSDISADQPILVAQFSNGSQFDHNNNSDPSMTLLQAVNQYQTSYIWTTPVVPAGENTDVQQPFPINYANLVAPAADVGTITLDGVAIAASLFLPIGTSGLYGAQVAVNQGNHVLQGPQPFGATLYGYNSFDAYSEPGGFNFRSLSVPTQLTLTPTTATDLVGTQDTVLATLVDQNGNPIAGATVTFQVSGANPTTGTIVTDASGHATFSYSGTHLGSDTIQASAAGLIATAQVSWISPPPLVSFTSPAGGTTLATGSGVELSGLARPGNPLVPVVLVTVNGVQVDAVDAAGDFFLHETIAAGTNTFTATATDNLGQRSTVTLTVIGVSGGPGAAQQQDATLLGQMNYSAVTFNRHTLTLFAQASMTDTSAGSLSGPIDAVFQNFTPAGETLASPAGTTAQGNAFLLMEPGGSALAAGQTSSPVTLAISNPQEARFSFNVTLLASGNTLPVFSSAPLTEAGVASAYTYQAAVSEPDGDPVKFSLPMAPAGMTINSTTGLISWTPSASQLGAQQVQVQADDGRGGTALQSFTIQVSSTLVNRPPVFQSAPLTQAAVGASYAYTPTVFDPDAGETLTFSLSSAPPRMTINSATGQVTYPANTAGSFAVSIRVDDGRGGVAIQSYVLVVGTGSTDAAVITSLPPDTAVVGTTYVYIPHTTDANGQPLMFSLLAGPVGMTLDGTTGQLVWTPLAGQVGPQTVTLSAADTLGGQAVQTFTVNVLAQAPDAPPVFQSSPPLVATQGVAYTYTPVASDLEGQSITYSLASAPTGMTVNSATGQINWTPAAPDIGPHLITLQAVDSAGQVGQQSFLLFVKVPTVAPTVTSTPPATATAGTTFRYLVSATDATDSFIFSLVNPPAGMTIDPQTGLVLWNPMTNDIGSHTIDIRLTNSRGAVSDQIFPLAVNPDTQPPSVSIQLSSTNVLPGQAVTITVTATDNVAVAPASLLVNGSPVALTPQSSALGTFLGTAIFTPTVAGTVVSIVATALDTSGNSAMATARLGVIDPADTDAPTIQITSPVSGDTVTYLTQITGSIPDADLLSYKLEYARAGTDQWVQFGGGNGPVTNNSALGTFDPTLLMNNGYTIRVTAQDASGNQAVREITVSVAGNAKIGNFHLEYTDLTIPVAGVSITVKRVYDTLQANLQGDFGYGWRLDIADPQLHETVPVSPLEQLLGMFAAHPFRQGTKIYLTNPNGKREGFTFTPIPEQSLFFGTLWQPNFVADPGVYDSLSVDIAPLVQDADGAFHLFGLGAPYNPQGFKLTNKDGTIYHYGKFTGLQSISDRNGNTLTFTPTGITSSSGPSIQFVRDTQGRISQIIDPADKTLNYTYDASGNLISFADQLANSSTYKYLDTPAHYLSQVIDPLGHQATGATYDANGRYIATTDALGNTSNLSYDLQNFTEHVADALGNITLLVYDSRGNVVSETDPLGNITKHVYDSNDNEIATTDPRGFTTQRTFDARGNVTSITDPLGGIQKFTYNQFNSVLTATDSLGRVTQFQFDQNGNLAKSTNAAGLSSSASYDALGRVTTATDNMGSVTKFIYGAGSLPTAIIYPDSSSIRMEYNSLGEVTRYVDANGNQILYAYDSAGRLLSRTDAQGNISSNFYDAANQLVQQTDALGRSYKYVYDNAGQRIQSIDPTGNMTQFFYDAAGHLVREIDPNGHSVDRTYLPTGKLASVTRGDPSTTSYEYDPTGNLSAIIDANGNKTQFVYDDLNRVSQIIDAQGNIIRYTHDLVGNITSLTDTNGHTTTHAFDELNHLIKTTDALGGTTTYGYDPNGNQTSVTDANGNSMISTYDLRNRLVQAVNALGGVHKYGYDPNGNLTSETDELGQVTTTVYDSLNRVVQNIDALGGKTVQSYDAAGNLISTTDTLGRTTTFTFDDLNRLIATVDPAGKTTQQSYDAVGNMTARVDQLGQLTQLAYDSQSRLISRTDPNGAVTKYSFDGVGNQTSMTDPLGRTTVMTYDSLNRVTTSVDPAGGVTRYAYDTWGNETSITDPAGQKTQYAYDALNRHVQQTDPLGNSSYFVYDSVGNLIQTTDRNGHIRKFAYDALGRQVQEQWRTGNTVIRNIQYSYDAVGNLLSASDPDSSYSYTYDVLDRVSSVDNSGTPSVPRTLLNYTYDSEGNVLSVKDNSGIQVSSSYDSRNLLVRKSWQGPGISAAREDISYDAKGQRTAMTRFADLAGTQLIGTTSETFDSVGRLTNLVHKDSNNNILASYQYGYDQAGELINETDNSVLTSYTFDVTGQVTSATHTGQANENYVYDSNGNRTSGGTIIGPGNQVLQDVRFTYAYDKEGNLLLKTEIATGTTTNFTYDFRNRLTSVVQSDSAGHVLHQANYTYDVFDRRIRTVVDGVATETVYDNEEPWADFDGSGNVLARYLVGPRTDEILARFRPGQGTAWYLPDHLGSIRDIVDASGHLLDHIDYSSFGAITRETNPSLGDRFKFTGREFGPESGLYYYRARYYDPDLGRFISQDPLLDTGFRDGTNPYRYAENHPLTATDPSGMAAASEYSVQSAPAASAAAVPEATYTIVEGSAAQAEQESLLEAVLEATEERMRNEQLLEEILARTPPITTGSGSVTITAVSSATADILIARGLATFAILAVVLGIETDTAVNTQTLQDQDPQGLSKHEVQAEAQFRNSPSDDIPKDHTDCKPEYAPLPLDDLGRATGVFAVIGPSSVGGPYKAFQRRPPDWWGKLPDAPANSSWQKGHLFGSQLGGPGGKDWRNMVALYEKANNPGMTQYENEIRGRAELGECILFEAIPTYSDDNYFPDGVTITAIGDRGYWLYVTVLNIP